MADIDDFDPDWRWLLPRFVLLASIGAFGGGLTLLFCMQFWFTRLTLTGQQAFFLIGVIPGLVAGAVGVILMVTYYDSTAPRRNMWWAFLLGPILLSPVFAVVLSLVIAAITFTTPVFPNTWFP